MVSDMVVVGCKQSFLHSIGLVPELSLIVLVKTV